jgi:DNA-directed RNA polymerase subunit M/transcription elongation factor TFIIS
MMGDNNLAKKDEIRKRISDAKIGRRVQHSRPLSERQLQHLKKVSEAKIGTSRPLEVRKRISQSKTGRGSGESNPFFGKSHSEEFLRSQSERMKTSWRDPNFTSNMKKKWRELWKTPSFREQQLRLRRSESYSTKISQILSKAWKDPDKRRSQSELMKKLWQNKDYQEAVLRATNCRTSQLENLFFNLVRRLGLTPLKTFVLCSKCQYSVSCKHKKIGFKPDVYLIESNQIFEIEGGYFVRDIRKLSLLHQKQECYRRHGWELVVITYPRFKDRLKQEFQEATVETVYEALDRLKKSASIEIAYQL